VCLRELGESQPLLTQGNHCTNVLIPEAYNSKIIILSTEPKATPWISIWQPLILDLDALP